MTARARWLRWVSVTVRSSGAIRRSIEETPAPGISDELRERLMHGCSELGEAVGYRSAGTVEYVYDTKTHEFYFLEVNTRLQVEHGVTEEVTGVDLVEWMLRAAAGESAFLDSYEHKPSGHAIQVRVVCRRSG